MNEKIGKYEIQGRIGGGGFGLVYRAYDPFLKRTVAIKACLSREEKTRQRFYREAEILGSLRHRNITTVHDFGVQDEVPFLVEEYLEGEDLDQLIQRRTPLLLVQKLDYLLQIASGLDHAHARDIVHRDIKPSNIRVLANDEVKILDFGTAKRTTADTQLTQSGMTVGTAAYLSPEQIRGEPIGAHCDIFALGVLAFELLAYRRPFEGRNIPTVIQQILDDPAPRLSAIATSVPTELDAILTRCLAKRVADRYPSCAEVRRDLEDVIVDRLLHQEPSSSGGDPPSTDRVEAALARVRDHLHEEDHVHALLVLRWIQTVDPLRLADNHFWEEAHRGALRRRVGDVAAAAASPPPSVGRLQLDTLIDSLDRSRSRPEMAIPELHRVAATTLRQELQELVEHLRRALAAGIEHARRLMGVGQRAEAERRLRLLTEMEPDDGDAHRLLHTLLATTAVSTNDSRVAEAIVTVEGLIARGSLREAIDATLFSRRLLGRFPELPSLFRRLQRKLADELEDLETSIHLLVSSVASQAARARRLGHQTIAQRLLELGLDLSPKAAELLALDAPARADPATTAPSVAGAARRRAQANRQDREHDSLLLIARELIRAEQFEEAARALKQARRLAPEDEELQRLLAKLPKP